MAQRKPRGDAGSPRERSASGDAEQETGEWIESLDAVLREGGPERLRELLIALERRAAEAGVTLPHRANTPYVNTIPRDRQPRYAGDLELERRVRRLVRWNAMAMVVRANRAEEGIGGHISTFASAATLLEVGFNHFFRGPDAEDGGDQVYFQGHATPGVYSRAFLEGRLTEKQLENFRRELAPGGGLSSYPHPWLMPHFWSFPTVSMGLAPIMAIYQARYNRYLEDRGLAEPRGRVWAFFGDGETDEPESLGAITLASRERLDNLIFVINCNLQRLDGPVRGNGKIIQELEAVFRGAGWNVIKAIWGAGWDRLLAQDTSGRLVQRMEECVDGEYQTFKSRNGAYVREHFFGKYPETRELVADMSDAEIWALRRGGHDPEKVYAAYAAAVAHREQPTVILAKTVKGYGMGESGEGQMIAHQAKKMTQDALRQFRDRFEIPVSDEALPDIPFVTFAKGTPERDYLDARRGALGGFLPQRRRTSASLAAPPLSTFARLLNATGEREISTTMAFVQMLGMLIRDKTIGRHVVPIVPDESRTFGMEGMFRQLGIYSAVGQLYKPQDADQLMYYREDRKGQVLQEGINEAGGMCSWIAAATSYSTNDVPMLPFYIYYSMFGFQRFGDFAWAAGDMRSRGFLLGGTAGRTTLNGEGLQHEDGHSHVLASTIPNCVAYDPTFAYEVVVIIREGIRRMVEAQEDVYYYVTLMNENYPHPAMPAGAEAGIIRGLYLLQAGAETDGPRVQLIGSGTILREVIAAADLLRDDFGVSADIWSAPSFTELRRDGMSVERWNRLHPARAPRRSYVETCLAGHAGPVVAATDYMRAYADQIRSLVPRRYVVLGTDGFGRSDYRVKLRRFFEVDRHHVAVAALKALADEGRVASGVVADAIARYGLDAEQPDPWTV